MRSRYTQSVRLARNKREIYFAMSGKKECARVWESRSSDGQLVKGGISAIDEVIQLAINIIQQCGSSHSE